MNRSPFDRELIPLCTMMNPQMTEQYPYLNEYNVHDLLCILLNMMSLSVWYIFYMHAHRTHTCTHARISKCNTCIDIL